MLISRQELSFDFKGARLDPKTDRDLLSWIFNQFLYGEVTGIQCGYWLYNAPHLNAAAFLARQAAEELSHVKRFLKICSILGVEPGPPHKAIKFMSTGMMGGSWGEHVCMEMALGEGLVLTVFYALAKLIQSPEIIKIIEFSIPEEERHVEFGEKETIEWLKTHPKDREFFLAQAFLQIFAMKWLKGFVVKNLTKTLAQNQSGNEHPVLKQFPEFYDFVVNSLEVRLLKLGVLQVPFSQMSKVSKFYLLMKLPLFKLKQKFKRKKLLTETYLNDPVIKQKGPLISQEPFVNDPSSISKL